MATPDITVIESTIRSATLFFRGSDHVSSVLLTIGRMTRDGEVMVIIHTMDGEHSGSALHVTEVTGYLDRHRIDFGPLLTEALRHSPGIARDAEVAAAAEEVDVVENRIQYSHGDVAKARAALALAQAEWIASVLG